MEEESKTKFSMNVEFSFAFKTCFFVFVPLFPHALFCGILYRRCLPKVFASGKADDANRFGRYK